MVGAFLMAIFGDDMANIFANTIDRIGTRLGLPEMGVSEFLAGGNPTVNTQSVPLGGGGGGSWGPETPNSTTINTGGNTPATPATIPNNLTTLDPNNSDNIIQPETPSEQQVSEFYQPTLDYLNQAEGFARQNFSDQQQLLDQQKANQLTTLGENVEQQNQLITNQESRVANQRRANENEVTRYTNALLRSARNRFGGGSSAGTATHGIISEQALRNLAQVSQIHADAVNQLMADKQATQLYFTQESRKIDEQHSSKMAELRSWLNNTINDIIFSKANTEREKAGLRLDALNRASDLVTQQRIQIEADKRALDTWFAQQKFLQDQTYNALVQDAYASQVSPESLFTSASQNRIGTVTPANVSSSIINPRYNPNSADDELSTFLSLG